ncbi:MAG: NAD(+)/NADH kinase [Verrucomicrobia bacterium]|nr:NAD(+)/NADH kinase [Verrucomicrobiota bacterium]
MHAIESIAFFINQTKSGAPELAEELIAIAKKECRSIKDTSKYPLEPDFLKDVSACCVIGGDGTLLGVAEACANQSVPVIGVNRGGLGFLTTFSGEEAARLFPQVLKGEYCITERSMLQASSTGGGATTALNDAVIKEIRSGDILNLEVCNEAGWITDYLCDGIIFTTPTGSTAYNLSAGGPLIDPSAKVLAMTPICPHTLSNRSIIFDSGAKLTVKDVSQSKTLQVILDGANRLTINPGESVTLELSPEKLSLIHQKDFNHFEVVRTKLKWSGSHKQRS